jgi:hypothetical protein
VSLGFSSGNISSTFFKWRDLITHHTQQLTWTVLPHGFRESPHIFSQVLQQDLNFLNLFTSKLIPYVDDLCSPSKSFCKTHTIILLNLLAKKLDPIYRGWPACLKVLATAALLIPEAQKITFNLPMTVWSSHNIQDLISHKALNSISPSHVQSLYFLLQPDLTFC